MNETRVHTCHENCDNPVCLLVRERNALSTQLTSLQSENARLREALESISKNGCCDTCQEAKLVALKALASISAAVGGGKDGTKV